MSTLHAAWFGEFGWELLSWQGYVRRVARKNKVCVLCPRGHAVLYEDWATDIVEHDVGGNLDAWTTDAKEERAASIAKWTNGGLALPCRLFTIQQQLFIPFGDKRSAECYDVVIHARAVYGKRGEDSWPLEDWNVLVDLLLKEKLTVAAIGTKDKAMLPEGAQDLRGIPLPRLMNVTAASRLVVGPSSGPMHLASLCRTKHVVWASKRKWVLSGNHTARQKYEKSWNPFKTPVTVLDEHGWRPPVPVVLSAIKKALGLA